MPIETENFGSPVDQPHAEQGGPEAGPEGEAMRGPESESGFGGFDRGRSHRRRRGAFAGGTQQADATAQMEELVEEVSEPVEEYVRQNPMKSVIIAACIGAAFGFLCLRR